MGVKAMLYCDVDVARLACGWVLEGVEMWWMALLGLFDVMRGCVLAMWLGRSIWFLVDAEEGMEGGGRLLGR